MERVGPLSLCLCFNSPQPNHTADIPEALGQPEVFTTRPQTFQWLLWSDGRMGSRKSSTATAVTGSMGTEKSSSGSGIPLGTTLVLRM